jgi:hypothetical protein
MTHRSGVSLREQIRHHGGTVSLARGRGGTTHSASWPPELAGGDAAVRVVPRRGPLAAVWHRIRLAVREMNYASRRIVEVQAPWTVDEQWHQR